MKSLITVIVALAFAAPVLSFAQANQQSLTRAQVRADVVKAERAGYGPTAWADFPEGEIQAAEFRAAAQKAAAAGYGRDWSGAFQSGDVAR
ncbi:DUF4148 domain-containing protein [Caballeronia sp. J97]|uniref:DUF4148 domain-containing protein n=1 Tax=Caballeronia sp. J97 TaxID=2805429 RepID=UPI002AB1A157|nr:DUF4148 domain-containing protein [Caballeronia sp. J97]